MLNKFLNLYFIFLIIGQIRLIMVSSVYFEDILREPYIYSLYLFYAFFVLFMILEIIKTKKEILVSKIELFLLSFPFFSILVKYEDISYSYQYLLTDFLMPFLFICSIILAKNSSALASLKINLTVVRLFFYTCLITVLVGQFIDLSYQSLLNIHFIFCFIYFLFRKKYIESFISSLVILFSGKRGLLAGYVAIFSLNKLFLLILIPFFAIGIYFLYELIPGKLIRTLTFNDIEELIVILGPRFIEVKEALAEFTSKEPLSWLVGLGSGFYYTIENAIGQTQITHNAHFSPVGILTTYGLIYTIIFYYYICSIIFSKVQKEHLAWVFKYYAISGLLFSLTSYSLFVDFLFLLSVAYMSNYNVFENKRNNVN